MSAIESKEAFSANPEPSLVERLRAMVPLCEDEANYIDDDRALLTAADRIEVLEAALLYASTQMSPVANYTPIIEALELGNYEELRALALKEPRQMSQETMDIIDAEVRRYGMLGDGK